MPGAKFFPDATLNFARICCRDGGDDLAVIFKGEDRPCSFDDARRALSRGRGVCGRRSAAKASILATVSPATCRTCPKRSSPRSARRRSAPCGRRARLTSARRAFSTDSARSRRRYSSPPTDIPTAESAMTAVRESPKSFARCRRCSGPCSFLPRTRRDGTPIRDARHLGRLSSPGARLRPRVRAAAFQPSALHPVFVGHHRRAEVHRARRRRHAHPASQGAPAPLRHPRRRSRLLLHDVRLDDVELAGLGAGVGRDARALRRLALPSGRQRRCSIWPTRRA